MEGFIHIRELLPSAVRHDEGRIPRDPEKNTASVAAKAMLDALGARCGVALTIDKGLPLSSGLGGSAASAAAAVVAVNALVGGNATIDRSKAALRRAVRAFEVRCRD